MRAIVVPLDGSSFAETALPTAFALARRSPGTRVDAVVVLDPPPPAIPLGGAPAIDPRFDHDRYAEMERYAATMRAELPRRAGDVATGVTVLYGDAADCLARFAADGDYDLLVMTTHGRSGVRRAVLGSVADALVRRSRIPVLLLREAHERPPYGAPIATDVVVPIDEGRVSEEILPDAIAVAGGDARFHLVHVVVPPRWVPPPSALEVVTAGDAPAVDEESLLGASRDAAVRRLGRVADQLRPRGLEVQAHIPVHAHPAEAIGAVAREHGATLIAMTTHGRHGADRLLLGSVADAVLRTTDVPLLLRVPRPG